MQEPAPAENRSADCQSPCCVAAPEPIPLTVSPSLAALAEAPAEATDTIIWPVATPPTTSVEGERLEPPRLYLQTGRIRV
jgi:hypothetical protein